MLKFLNEKILKIIKDKRGGGEILAFVLVIIFVILAAAGPLKTIGQTTSTGINSLDTELKSQLNVTTP